MHKYIILLLLVLINTPPASASTSLKSKLSGKILLQVESLGEAWYVNPGNQKKYLLGKPSEAFKVMRELGIGITNSNLDKIPIGLVASKTTDTDKDGLPDGLENAIGTLLDNGDSDDDGYDDKTEIESGYNPTGGEKTKIDTNFTKLNIGKIFLQVEKNGEAWYVDPESKKRYFLGRPIDAFSIMKNLGLGITNEDINKISTGIFYEDIIVPNPIPVASNENVIEKAASAIRAGNTSELITYFIPEIRMVIKYTMDFLNSEGKLSLGNILSGSSLKSSSDSEKIYSNTIYFNGKNNQITFTVEKQNDGSWLITNL